MDRPLCSTLVRPQLVSTAPVFWQWISGAGRGGAAVAIRDMRSPARGGNLTMYPVSGDGPKSSQTVHRELTFGTSGELLCLVAGQDINRT